MEVAKLKMFYKKLKLFFLTPIFLTVNHQHSMYDTMAMAMALTLTDLPFLEQILM